MIATTLTFSANCIRPTAIGGPEICFLRLRISGRRDRSHPCKIPSPRQLLARDGWHRRKLGHPRRSYRLRMPNLPQSTRGCSDIAPNPPPPSSQGVCRPSANARCGPKQSRCNGRNSHRLQGSVRMCATGAPKYDQHRPPPSYGLRFACSSF